MIGGGLIFDGEGSGRAQALGNHQNLVVDQVVLLNLELRIVLCILLNQVDLEPIDAPVIFDGLEEALYPARQGFAYRIFNRPGQWCQDTECDCFVGQVDDPIGKPLARGIEVFFKSVNDHGGIDGFKVNLVEKDTQYNPQIQVQQYGLIHNQGLMIAESLGTPTTFAIKDQSASDRMLASAATLSSALAREKYLILIGTPYRLQVENAFDYVVNKLGIKNPATGIIYQNDEYGQDGLTGYNEAVTAYQLHDVGKASYAVTDTDFTAQVSQLKAAGAKYVFLTSTPGYTAKIIGTAHALGYDPQWILQSPAFSPLLLAVPALVPLLSKAWIVSQGAAWGDTSKPGMKALLDDVAKYAPDQKPDGFFEFGYTESKINYAILKKAIENNDLTRDGLLTAFDSW